MSGVPELRRMVPEDIMLPAEYSSAAITVGLAVRADGKVFAPGLGELQGALARGSVEVVQSYCEMWTRWLARVEREGAAAEDGGGPVTLANRIRAAVAEQYERAGRADPVPEHGEAGGVKWWISGEEPEQRVFDGGFMCHCGEVFSQESSGSNMLQAFASLLEHIEEKTRAVAGEPVS